MHDCCSFLKPSKNQSNRRDFLQLVASGALATTVAGIPGKASAALDEIRIGYLPITDASLLLTAHGQGFFADKGLNVAKPKLFRGWTPLVEAFIAGEINLTHMLNPIPVWLRHNNNLPVKIISWGHVNGSAVLVGPKTGITEFSQLSGSKMGIPSPYSVHNIILQRQLRNAGLKPFVGPLDADVPDGHVGLSVMPPPDMVKALATGKISGYTVAEPFNTMGEVIAKGSVLRFTGDVWKNHPCCVITMNENDVSAAPEKAQAVTDALVQAAFFAVEDRPRLAGMLSREGKGYLPMPTKLIQAALTNYDSGKYGASGAIQHPDWDIGRIDFNPYPYHSATRMIVEYMSETAIEGEKIYAIEKDPDVAAKELVDDRYIRKSLMNASGWEAALGADSASPFERTETINI